MDDTRRPDAGTPAQSQASDPENPSASAPRSRTPWNTVSGRVISLVSSKGGVGKTTSAVNLGAALALSGHTVLVVGTDPQCGVCRTLGPGPEHLTTGLGEIFNAARPLTDLVQASPLSDLYFVSPRVTSLDSEETLLTDFTDRVDDFVREIDRARNLFDTILIDCPPSIGPATRAALLASDSYLVPVQAEELCRSSVNDLLEYIDSFRERAYPVEDPVQASGWGTGLPEAPADCEVAPLELEGMFLTMASNRTRMGRHVAARVAEDYPEVLFEVGIPRTVRLSEMALKGKPVVIYDRKSAGSRAYFDLADELVNRYCQNHGASDVEDAQEQDREATAAIDPAAANPNWSPSGDDIIGDSRTEQTLTAETEDYVNGGGLDRFLAALGGAERSESSVPVFEEPTTPEMVSLDDLLAEEESKGHKSDEDWDDEYWSGDGKDRSRPN